MAEEVLAALERQGWDALSSDGAGLVVYGVVAERDGQEYSALMTSLYVRRPDGWKLAFHQQTPR